MSRALVGYTGFVGSTLLRQTSFDALYNSKNIAEIEGTSPELMVIAAAPAQKWIANANPEEDLKKIKNLIAHLYTANPKFVILISTVDVFRFPVMVSERTEVDEEGLHAYGRNRRYLEKYVEQQYRDNHLIVRLPGLVGTGLRKNFIFDLHNDKDVMGVDSRDVFQFYPMDHLMYDICVAWDHGIQLIHLTAAPISAQQAARAFGTIFVHNVDRQLINYDMRTVNAWLYGKDGAYQYDQNDTIAAIERYARVEPLTWSE